MSTAPDRLYIGVFFVTGKKAKEKRQAVSKSIHIRSLRAEGLAGVPGAHANLGKMTGLRGYRMENQRIRISKTMLKDALIDILRDKSIEKVTITELCAKAQVNRTTFYKYYGSQYDLLMDIEADLFHELERVLLLEQNRDMETLVAIVHCLDQNQDTWKVLINSMGDQAFTQRLFSLPIIQTFFRQRTKAELTPAQEAYVYVFFCQGSYAILRRWLNRENHEPPEEIARLIMLLANQVLGV